MASARDHASDLTRTPTGARPPLPTRPRLRPIASPAMPPFGRQPKLLDRLHDDLRTRHHSRRIKQSSCQWVKRCIFLQNVRHPADMAETEINAFLTHLALNERVSAPTQTQALSALLAPRPLTASVRREGKRGR